MNKLNRFNRTSAIAAFVASALCSVEGEPAAAGGTVEPAAAAPDAKPDAKPAKAAKKPAPKGKKAKPAKKAAKKTAKKAKAKDGDAVTGPAILKQYAPDYIKGGKDGTAKTVSGNKTVDNGDELAAKLRGKALDDVYALAAKTLKDEDDKPITEKALRAKYAHLNVGMQRMNLGNRIRAVLNAK